MAKYFMTIASGLQLLFFEIIWEGCLRKHLSISNRTIKMTGKSRMSKMIYHVIILTLLNSQPRILHFLLSDWFTKSQLSAHIP